MKIKVEFIGLPMVSKLVGGKSVSIDFPGKTIEDLVEHIAGRYDPKVRSFLLDEEGKLDMSFQVLLNGEEWVQRKEMGKTLRDGDAVAIMMLAAGG